MERLIGKIESGEGPTVVITAGIHGNEPSGIEAVRSVFKMLRANNHIVRGNFYGIAGNKAALLSGVRYLDKDLNRLWTQGNMHELKNDNLDPTIAEHQEMKEIFTLISRILKKNSGPFFFIDLHTTSSKTIPFLTINDTLINRKFALRFPLPVILGLEEYLDGPLFNYINDLGYVACGFEAGQHIDNVSLRNQAAFIWLVLKETGVLEKGSETEAAFAQLALLTNNRHEFFDIREYYRLHEGESFSMLPGFTNFQAIEKGTELAVSNGHGIIAAMKGLIFMPLYQQKGDDGFFIIRKIPIVFLWVSRLLRKIRFDNLVALLPGITWNSPQKNSLRIDLRIARFLARDFMHLLGYRSKQRDRNHLIISNRERFSKTAAYKGFLK